MRLRSVVIAILLVAGVPAVAGANPLKDKLTTADLEPYRAAPGQPLEKAADRFLADLKEIDPALSEEILVRAAYQVQQDELDKFGRQRGYVIAAYGVLWGVVAAFAVVLWLRQRKLTAALVDLESRLAAAGDREAVR